VLVEESERVGAGSSDGVCPPVRLNLSIEQSLAEEVDEGTALYVLAEVLGALKTALRAQAEGTVNETCTCGDGWGSACRPKV
jgi:hypothetical protein